MFLEICYTVFRISVQSIVDVLYEFLVILKIVSTGCMIILVDYPYFYVFQPLTQSVYSYDFVAENTQ